MTEYDRWIVLLNGMLSACYGVAALFFARFAKRTGDRFFSFFAGAFVLLMLQAAALQIFGRSEETRAPFYLVRLTAFALIAAAVIHKNRKR